MKPPTPPWTRFLAWPALAVVLLGYNLGLAQYANPFSMMEQHDGTQYQLLARNRLLGHDEVGDTSHTVQTEGRHPIWRPGLVWIHEGLARPAGSVQAAAGLASAAGTTCLEMAFVWLAWTVLGRAGAVLALLYLLLPGREFFLYLAVGQGPEAWAGACVLAGLAALITALRRQSWPLAVLAGGLAGASEWFRAANVVLFAVPCLVYAVAGWRQLGRRGLVVPAVALVALLVAVVPAGWWAAASKVDKTTVAFSHRVTDHTGMQVHRHPSEALCTVTYLGGLQLSPGAEATNCDRAMADARGVPAWKFLLAHRDLFLSQYVHDLGLVVSTGARGLRKMAGTWVVALFVVQLLLSLLYRGPASLHSLALGGAALAQYLGPIVVLRGNQPNHYVLVFLPLFVVVAIAGLLRLAAAARDGLARWLPEALSWRPSPTLRGLAVAAVVCLSLIHYAAFLRLVRGSWQNATVHRATLDDLHLEGKAVAVRGMGWFVDRDVRTRLLPYGSAEELAHYARVNGLDGLLLWDCDHMMNHFFCGFPYDTPADLHRALQEGGAFEAPRVSGAWCWYAVRRDALAARGTEAASSPERPN